MAVDYNLNANKRADVIQMLQSSTRTGASTVYTAASTPKPMYVDARGSTMPKKEIIWK